MCNSSLLGVLFMHIALTTGMAVLCTKNLSWRECVIVCPPVSGAGGEGDELIME